MTFSRSFWEKSSLPLAKVSLTRRWSLSFIADGWGLELAILISPGVGVAFYVVQPANCEAS
jgi:hypothetical protein